MNAHTPQRWEPTPGIISAALLHAGQEAPRESCGLVVGGEYVAIENIAPDDGSFLMDSRAFLEHSRRGGLEAVVHSHVYLPALASDSDRASCEATRLPWLIVSYPLGTFSVIRPAGFRAPLVGRAFAWGVHDCYGLVRDGLADYAGLSLPDFYRAPEFWITGDSSPIVEHFAEAGFVVMPQGTEPQHCDVFGIRVHGKVVNHLALFLAPDRILHQMRGRLSVIEIYGGIYQDLTEMHFRHRSLVRSP